MTRKRLFLMLAVIAATGAGLVSLIHAADPKIDANATKSTTLIKQSFTDVAREAAKSTVRILVQDADRSLPAAYGTVMTADGFILTKGSEVINHKKIFVKLPSGELEAQVVGIRESYDLAMLKIDATGLIPVTLANTAEASKPAPAPQRGARGGGFGGGGLGRGRGVSFPTGPIPSVEAPPAPPTGAVAVTVGEFVVTPEAAASEGKDLAPKSYGVISVERRAIPFSSGVLGVSLDDYYTPGSARPQGAIVTQVFMQSGAGRAGVKPDDIITAVDGSPVASRADLQALIHKHYPTDTVTLALTRGNQSLSLRVQLGDTIIATQEDVEMAVLSGNVNTRSSDFQAVFQHDTILAPSDMGGPLVDLEGHVIGINIARAGRTETYAIPADLLTERWLASMKDGTFAPRAKPAP